jgi:hypothetical protein
VLVEGPVASRIVARRAGHLAAPPEVWTICDRSLAPARPAAAELPVPMDPRDGRYVELLRAHGAQPEVEDGVLRGTVRGLEVARVVAGRLEVGVGRYDRHARAETRAGEDPGVALDEAVSAVHRWRRTGANSHPANTLARSRWLRSVLCARPDVVGAATLVAVSPPLTGADLTDNGAVPGLGQDLDGNPVVVVASTGVDPDLVPTAADCRAVYEPDARLVIAVPEGDDHPVTRALAGALATPAIVRTVPRTWAELGTC